MNLTDTVGTKGYLKITKVFDDKEEVAFEGQNLIVDAAKQEHLRFLWDGTVTQDIINGFKVGDDGTLDGEGLYPRTEDPTQTDLNNPILTSSNVNVSTPTANSVKFVFDVLNGEANDNLISEVGLFKQSGDIFNVKNFVAIPKTSAFSLHFEWTIVYA